MITQSSEPEGKILMYYFAYPVGQVSVWKQKFHFCMLTVDNGQITESSKHIFVHVFSGGMFLHAMNRAWNISTTCPTGSSYPCNTIQYIFLNVHCNGISLDVHIWTSFKVGGLTRTEASCKMYLIKKSFDFNIKYVIYREIHK